MKKNPTKEDVLEFVSKFKFAYNKELEYIFTNGNCYYFTTILKERFGCGEIYYLPIANHFVWKHNGVYYDIKGVCGTSEKAHPWEEYKAADKSHSKRIVRDCINFETR